MVNRPNPRATKTVNRPNPQMAKAMNRANKAAEKEAKARNLRKARAAVRAAKVPDLPTNPAVARKEVARSHPVLVAKTVNRPNPQMTKAVNPANRAAVKEAKARNHRKGRATVRAAKVPNLPANPAAARKEVAQNRPVVAAKAVKRPNPRVAKANLKWLKVEEFLNYPVVQ